MPKSKSPPATPRSGPTPTTRSDDASPKNAKTNLPGQVPIRNAPISSGTERDYFRSTPTKATTPISTPTRTASEPLAQVFDNAKDGKQYLAYFHTDQNRHPARDDRHPRQSLMVRRIHRLGSSEKGRAGFTRTRISRSDCKTSIMMKKPGCITT